MGWSFPWVSSGESDFNLDFGISGTEEATREWVTPMLERGEMPPVEGFGVNVFARGVEFLMHYYPILDRVPKGRDEGDAFQMWLRRHDEYDSE